MRWNEDSSLKPVVHLEDLIFDVLFIKREGRFKHWSQTTGAQAQCERLIIACDHALSLCLCNLFSKKQRSRKKNNAWSLVRLIINISAFIRKILEIAVNIKDLYGNSGKRFKKVNTCWNFQWNTPYLIHFTCFCLLCGYFPDPFWFKKFQPRVSKQWIGLFY